MATGANQVMMGMKVGIDTPGAMVRADLAQQANFDEGLKVLVDGSQRNRRQTRFHVLVDLLRRVMSRARRQGLIDTLPLMRYRQIVLAAQLAKLVASLPAHIYRMIKLIKRFRASLLCRTT